MTTLSEVLEEESNRCGRLWRAAGEETTFETLKKCRDDHTLFERDKEGHTSKEKGKIFSSFRNAISFIIPAAT